MKTFLSFSKPILGDPIMQYTQKWSLLLRSPKPMRSYNPFKEQNKADFSLLYKVIHSSSPYIHIFPTEKTNFIVLFLH